MSRTRLIGVGLIPSKAAQKSQIALVKELTISLSLFDFLSSFGHFEMLEIQGQHAFHDDNIGSLSFMFRDHVLTSMHTLL